MLPSHQTNMAPRTPITKMPTRRAQAQEKAISTVLSTPELLTLILSHLPPQDLLLRAQLTSKTWRTLTQTQPLLRQALFLDPSSEQPPVLNPLLIKAFPIFFRTSPFHPSDFHSLPWSKNPDAFKRKGASWREMLPLSSGGDVRAVRRWSQMGGSREIVGKVEGGMRMGLCWDVSRTLCSSEMSSIFWCWRDDVGLGKAHFQGEYERRYGETEELEIRVQSTLSCIATLWDEEAEKAAEREEKRRVEEDAFFRCEGAVVDVKWGEVRETFETREYRLMMPVYQKEMEMAAAMPIPDDDEADL